MALLCRFCPILLLLTALSAVAQIQTEFLRCEAETDDGAPQVGFDKTEPAGKELTISRLIFVGDTQLPISVQQDIEKSLTQLRYQDDKEFLSNLSERVRDAWQQHGYFNVQVGNPNIDQRSITNSENTVTITVRVEAGKQYRLDGIRFEGNSQFTAGALRSMFPISDGEILDTHKIREGIEALRAAYGAKGFINFTAAPEAKTDEERDLVDLTIVLDEGKQFHVGRVQVRGLEPRLALKMIHDSGLEPGGIFDMSKEHFFERQSGSLPAGFKAVEDIEHRVNDRDGTVDLLMDFHGCRQTTTP